MFFPNRQKIIQTQIVSYRNEVTDCANAFQFALTEYSKTNDRTALKEAYHKVHQFESKADDIRREIEDTMYSKAIFPESRGDILGLLESLDRIPNQMESVLSTIFTHNISIPKQLSADILNLTNLCHRATIALLDGADKLFSDFTAATVAVGKVDEIESEADNAEFLLYEKIFTQSLEPIQQLLLRDTVKHLAAITDRAENAGDRIRIIVAKRRI